MATLAQLTPVDFELHAGNFLLLEVTAKDENDAVVNITGMTIKWELREDPFSTTVIVTKSIGSGITIINAALGRFDIAIETADTATLTAPANLYHEAQITDAASKPRTALKGNVRLMIAAVT